MTAIQTGTRTFDGLAVYDLDPQASQLWAVAGPDGIDPSTIDPDSLPDGFRWVQREEWEQLEVAKTTRKVIVVRAKAFSGEGVKHNTVLVEGQAVYVWDSVARHFTSCHALSQRAMKRIVRLASGPEANKIYTV